MQSVPNTPNMLSKSPTSAAFFTAVLLFALVPKTSAQAPGAPTPTPTPTPAPAPAPAAPAAPAKPAAQVPLAVVSVGTMKRMFGEAEAAFVAKDYATAITKIKELLVALGPVQEDWTEVLYFNLGLGNLLSNKFAEAEAAFTDCIKRFPKGEYLSRCYLGLGRACILQDTPEKKQQAIEALKKAAGDPKFRSEAGLWLGQVYTALGKKDEALVVFRSLMGSDVSTPQQTTAAVEVIGLLAAGGNLENLTLYLDRVSRQAGVRDSIAWFANQVVVRGDEMVGTQAYTAALALYQVIPPRSEILATQNSALTVLRKKQKILEATVASEVDKPIEQHSKAAELLAGLTPAIDLAETARKTIEEKADLDAALLMRRGRCLFYMNRYEGALVCFRTLRTKHATSVDASAAAFAEIVIYNKLNNVPEIREKSALFMRKYPTSDKIEQVAGLAGEVLLQSKNWKEIGSFFRDLETKFPKSETLDRYLFFQGVAFFMDGNFQESTPLFTRLLKEFPTSQVTETALYYMAMSNFLNNKYKESLASCKDYLTKFPNGTYAGDMHYRLAFIDFNDKQEDQSDKIIRDLTSFLKDSPDDAANGSMLCLIADTYKRKKTASDAEALANENAALAAYKQAIVTASPDDIMQYALDSATAIMQKKKDWAGIATLHGAFLKDHQDSPIALLSASWVARMMMREGKGAAAAEMLAEVVQSRIADPANEQVEFLLDEIVKTIVPKKKAAEIDVEAIDKQLVDVLNKICRGKENATTAARIYYARARLAQMLKRTDRADLYLKGIATTNAKDPSGLSPALLAVSGDILIKTNDLDGATAMFTRLANRYRESQFSDAGPVGLGYIALARKQYDEALKIFDDALETNPGMSRFKEATLGKLQALVELSKLEPAEKLALSIVGDKTFRGETVAKTYLLLGQVYRKQAAKATGAEATALLKKAHGIYQRVYVAYQSLPDLCADAYWQAYETATALGEDQLANETLKALSTHKKLQNTPQAKKAAGLVQ